MKQCEAFFACRRTVRSFAVGRGSHFNFFVLSTVGPETPLPYELAVLRLSHVALPLSEVGSILYNLRHPLEQLHRPHCLIRGSVRAAIWKADTAIGRRSTLYCFIAPHRHMEAAQKLQIEQ
jgi:hypothetical protein